jgi:hypothetical protein
VADHASYFIMDLSNLGEDEKDAIVSVQYYILYIFIELFYRISEYSVLFVVLRTVNVFAFADYGNPAAHKKARHTTFIILGVVGLVSLTTFCLVASYYGLFANEKFYALDNLVSAIIGFYVTYNVVYSVAAFYMIGVAGMGLARTRSKVRVPWRLAIMIRIKLNHLLMGFSGIANNIACRYKPCAACCRLSS